VVDENALGRFRLDGKVAVVTGGSRGIGRAIALGLADAGADVVIASRDQDKCILVAGEIGHRGVRGFGVCLDATREASLDELFERVLRDTGGCDVLVHAAGLARMGKATEVPRDDLQAMVDVHLLGAIGAAQRAAKQMSGRGGGAILFVTSTFALVGRSGTLAYAAAKAGLLGAVQTLAVEWAPLGIRVNALAPGLVATDMTAGVLADKKIEEKMLREIPMRRAANPEEMVGPALLMCSPAGSFITGHVLVADGGETTR
jgi:NAD(P)-dependent dehydrogenase (short-subunit alcohol dehydrogenase family)